MPSFVDSTFDFYKGMKSGIEKLEFIQKLTEALSEEWIIDCLEGNSFSNTLTLVLKLCSTVTMNDQASSAEKQIGDYLQLVLDLLLNRKNCSFIFSTLLRILNDIVPSNMEEGMDSCSFCTKIRLKIND